MAQISQKTISRTSLRTNSTFSASQSRDVPTKLSSQSFFIAHENSIPKPLSLTISPTPFTPSKNNVSTSQPSETLPQLDQLALIDNIPSQPTSTDNTNSKRVLSIPVKIIDIASNQPQPIPTDNNRQLQIPADNKRSPNNNRPTPIPTEHNRQLPIPTDNNQPPNNNRPPDNTDITGKQPLPTSTDINTITNQPKQTSNDFFAQPHSELKFQVPLNTQRTHSPLNTQPLLNTQPQTQPTAKSPDDGNFNPQFTSNIQSEFIPSATDKQGPQSSSSTNKDLSPNNQKHNKLKDRIFASFSTKPRPFISPTITVTSNNTDPSPLPVDPPELFGIIIAAIIAIIVIVLIIKKITFGEMSIEPSEKRQFSIQNDILNVHTDNNNNNNNNNNLRFGNDYVINEGLDEMNDPLFDRHDLDMINLQQNQEYTSKRCKKTLFFDNLKRWFNNIFNRRNNMFRLNSLTSSVMNSMDTPKGFDQKKSNIVSMESEMAEDSGVGVTSMCETEISFPDIHSHVLNWEEYIL